MQLIKLQHTDPSKRTVEMEKDKYELLKRLVVKILKNRPRSSFEQLVTDVTKELADSDNPIKGSIQWNLGWVTMDLRAKNEISKDQSVDPPLYSLKQ